MQAATVQGKPRVLNKSELVSKIPRSALDAKLVNSFLKGLIGVIGKTTDLKIELVQTIPAQYFSASGDLTSVVDIVGPNNKGFVALSLPLSLTNKMVAQYKATTESRMNSELRSDGLLELSNMIVSVVLKELREAGCLQAYRLSLPNVLTGKGRHSHRYAKKLASLLFEFSAEGYLFTLQICF